MDRPAPFDPVTIPTRRGVALTLRPATADDGAGWAAHVRDDLEHLGEHLTWPEQTDTVAGADAFIERYLRREDGRELLLVLDDGRALAGGTVLMAHDPRVAAVELGCWIVRGLEGQGAARRACLATVDHARRALAAHRIAWVAAADNRRSRVLAERLGFHHEGRLREAGLHRGRRQDLDVLSLVGTEIDEAVAARP
jgi:ribosomal-protein-serine acetyltransferase